VGGAGGFDWGEPRRGGEVEEGGGGGEDSEESAGFDGELNDWPWWGIEKPAPLTKTRRVRHLGENVARWSGANA